MGDAKSDLGGVRWVPIREDDERWNRLVEESRRRAKEPQAYPLWTKLYSWAFDQEVERAQAIVPLAKTLHTEAKVWAVWRPERDDPVIELFEETKILLDDHDHTAIASLAPLYVEGINAGAFAMELVGEAAVLFDHRLYWILRLIAEAIADIYDRAILEDPPNFDELLKRSTVSFRRISFAMLAFTEQGHDNLRIARFHTTRNEDSLESRGIVGGALMFLFLHEFGHFVKGHVTRSSASVPTLQNVSVHTPDQAQEFEADEFAVRTLFRRVGDESAPFNFIGIYAFFQLARFLDWFCESVEGEAFSDTHPGSDERWDRVSTVLDEELSSGKWLGTSARDQKDVTIRVLKEIFDSVLVNLHDALGSGQVTVPEIDWSFGFLGPGTVPVGINWFDSGRTAQ